MRNRAIVFVVAAAIAGLLLINFCALVYRCGCQSLWAGAADHCNIHNPQSRHCPWCSVGTLGFSGIALSIVATQAWVAFGHHRLGMWGRLVGSLLAFPVVGGLIAVALGIQQGYWSQ